MPLYRYCARNVLSRVREKARLLYREFHCTVALLRRLNIFGLIVKKVVSTGKYTRNVTIACRNARYAASILIFHEMTMQ